ncbi:MAG: PhzF family phenazine biosynthesis protein, partial [Candidatus Izimaplasma sp.]|nr:PhzF family phenazine biosynthesis protein [Candidatus Izimaplasma bacterium]
SEVGLCGHATIATFNLLRDEGIITEGFYTQETGVGILKLEVKSDIVYMEQVPPIYGEFIDPIEIENCFNTSNVIETKLPIRILSTGMKEIFVPLRSIKELNSLVADIDKINEISLKYDVVGIHCFALSDENNVDAYGRNFAPIVGINEESATGTSNGALGCYLNNYVKKDKMSFILRQGYSMNKPSEIITKLTKIKGEIVTIFVGGSAKRI